MEGGLSFSDESHAIAAAIAGQGTALLSSVLVRDELERGTLVQPFGPRLRGNRYHLVHLPSADRSPAVRAVRTWILDEASRDRSS